MPTHTLIPPREELKHAGHLAGILARRCALLTFPMIAQHDLGIDHPLTSSRVLVMDSADHLHSDPNFGVSLHVPARQATLPWLIESMGEATSSPRALTHVIQIASWNHQANPAPPDEIIRFMDAMRDPDSKDSHSILVELLPAASLDPPPIIELLDRHFGGRVPLFSIEGDSLVFHSLPEHHLKWSSGGIANLLAISACYKAFHSLVAAVEEVEPNETVTLLNIFEEIFSNVAS